MILQFNLDFVSQGCASFELLCSTGIHREVEHGPPNCRAFARFHFVIYICILYNM